MTIADKLQPLPTPIVVDRAMPNRAYVTLGFADEEHCDRFTKAICGQTKWFSEPHCWMHKKFMHDCSGCSTALAQEHISDSWRLRAQNLVDRIKATQPPNVLLQQLDQLLEARVLIEALLFLNKD